MIESYRKEFIQFMNEKYKTKTFFLPSLAYHQRNDLQSKWKLKQIRQNYQRNKLQHDNQYHQGYWIYFKDIKDNMLHERCIERANNILQNVSFFYFWNSQLSFKFFQKMSINKWTIRGFCFHNCNLGNSIIYRLKILNLNNLRQLSLALDSFDNRGLKTLMSIPLQTLYKLTLHHTMITTDGIRTLKKKIGNFGIVVIKKQHRFNYTAVLRQFGCLRNQKAQQRRFLWTKIGFMVQVDTLDNQDHFVYTGYVSKLQKFNKILTKIKIRDDPRYVPDWKKYMMVPCSVMKNIENIIDIVNKK